MCYLYERRAFSDGALTRQGRFSSALSMGRNYGRSRSHFVELVNGIVKSMCACVRLTPACACGQC